MRDAHPFHDAAAGNATALHARTDGLIRGIGAEGVLPEQPGFRAISPAGGTNVSAENVARWMQVQLNRGRAPDGRQVFSHAQAKTMWAPMVTVPSDEFKLPPAYAAMQPGLQTYALGWFVESYRGHIVVEHSGAVFGAVSMVYLTPEANIGIPVSSNSEDSGTRRAVMFHLLGLEPADWIAPDRRARRVRAKGANGIGQHP